MKRKIAFGLSVMLAVVAIILTVTNEPISYAKEAEVMLSVPAGIKKENEFQVTVKVDSNVELYSVDAYIHYDADKLEFVQTDSTAVGAEGVIELKDTYAMETKQATYTITFKAIEVGDVSISLGEVYLIDYADLDYVAVNSSSRTFTIGINKNIEMDARLSDLLVAPGNLVETFSPDLFEYTMHVGLDVEEILLSAIPMETDSLVDVEKPDKLAIGKNEILITVTALSGKINTYTIFVYKEEVTEIEDDAEDEATTEATSEAGDEATTEDASETEDDSGTTGELE